MCSLNNENIDSEVSVRKSYPLGEYSIGTVDGDIRSSASAWFYKNEYIIAEYPDNGKI